MLNGKELEMQKSELLWSLSGTQKQAQNGGPAKNFELGKMVHP